MISPLDEFADKFRQLQHALDGLVAVAVEYLMLAAAAAGDSSEYEITPQIFNVATAVVQLSEAAEAVHKLIRHCQIQGHREVPPELNAARAAAKPATDRYLSTLSSGMFEPGGLGSRYLSNVEPTLRCAAEWANIVLDKKARQVRGIPTTRDYCRDLERAEYRYYNFIAALLHVLALDAVRATAEGGDVSEASRAIVSKVFELSRVLEKERQLFEADGIEPPLLAKRARNKALQDEITDELRSFIDGYPKGLLNIPDKRIYALLHGTLSRGMERFGLMILSALVGDDDDASLELLRKFDADQIKYARVMHS